MRNNIFRRARLKLTVFYAGSIMLILAIFSIGVYVLFEGDVAGDFESTGQDTQYEEQLQQQFASDARQRLLLTLAIVDLGTSVLAISLGWFLSDKTLAPIQTASKKQQQFVSDAAHELRTPLSVMKAGLETIEAGSEPKIEHYQRLNRELREEIDRVVVLSNDLLFLSQSDQAALLGAKSQVDISAVCSRQVELMKSYARQKGVRSRSEIQPGLRINGDEDQINRLVLNLLKNAVDYNRKGGESFLTLSGSGRKIVLEISDSGIGMSREDLVHVCERFFKSEKSRERLDGGAGLGLSIVEEIVRFHDGKMKIESKLGVGTKVTVIIDS